MEISRTAVVGAAAFLAGVLITYAVGTSSRGALEAQMRGQEELSARVSALGETVEGRLDALQGRLDGLETSVKGLAERQGGEISGLVERLDERLHGLGSEVSGALSGLGDDVAGALAGDFERLRARIAELAARGAAGAGGSGAASLAGATAGGEAAGAAPEGDVLEVGKAATLADGRLRLFLSAADPQAGAARVAVNGVEILALALGETVDAGGCRLTLSGFSEGGAVVNADCGAAAGGEAPATPEAAPEAAPETTPAPAPAAASAEPGSGETIAVGASGAVAEGVRAFVSAVDPEAGVARVAFNGVELTELRLGQPIQVGTCTAELTAAAPGQATIAFGC